jgi:hypothetical protein
MFESHALRQGFGTSGPCALVSRCRLDVENFAWRSIAAALGVFWSACASDAPADATLPAAGAAGQGNVSAAGALGTNGGAGGASTGGAGGAGASSAGAPASGGAASGTSSVGGVTSNGGGGEATSAGTSNGGGGGVGGASEAGAGPVIPPGCTVSNPVSFKADIGPWLNKSCGKGGGSGCHVTDDSSTANSLCPDGTKTCGFNHAYDWITAGSHNEFCRQTPAPIRYTVVMAVLESANPPTCSKTRVMPPDGPPTSDCQKAALAAWLAEPKVMQLHRADDTSPTEPYLMPPFN